MLDILGAVLTIILSCFGFGNLPEVADGDDESNLSGSIVSSDDKEKVDNNDKESSKLPELEIMDPPKCDFDPNYDWQYQMFANIRFLFLNFMI